MVRLTSVKKAIAVPLPDSSTKYHKHLAIIVDKSPSSPITGATPHRIGTPREIKPLMFSESKVNTEGKDKSTTKTTLLIFLAI